MISSQQEAAQQAILDLLAEHGPSLAASAKAALAAAGHSSNAISKATASLRKRDVLLIEKERSSWGRFWWWLPGQADPREEESPKPEGANTDADGDVPRAKRFVSNGFLPSWPVSNIDAALGGGAGGPRPTVLSRSDGACLFYPGRLNVPFGPSESGKGWLIMLAAKQQLEAELPWISVDFEDTIASAVDRLRKLGVRDDLIRSGFVHVDLTEQLTPQQWAELSDLYQAWPGTLTTFDALAELADLYGKDNERNPEVTSLFREVLLRVSRLGATVGAVDHTPGANTKKLIGAQYKKSGADGTVVRVDVKTQFGPGQTGSADLWVIKDRHGWVRAVSKDPTKRESLFGTFYLASDEGGRITRAEIVPPPGMSSIAEDKAEVIAWVEGHGGGTKADLENAIGKKAEAVRATLAAVIEEGAITIEVRGKAHRLWITGQEPFGSTQADL